MAVAPSLTSLNPPAELFFSLLFYIIIFVPITDSKLKSIGFEFLKLFFCSLG